MVLGGFHNCEFREPPGFRSSTVPIALIPSRRGGGQRRRGGRLRRRRGRRRQTTGTTRRKKKKRETSVFGEAYRPAIWNTADQFLRRLRTVDADTRTSFVADFERAPLSRTGWYETGRGEPAINRATRRFSESVIDSGGLADFRKSAAKKRNRPEECFTRWSGTVHDKAWSRSIHRVKRIHRHE